MCGIVGLLNAASSPPDDLRDIVGVMARELEHRGPDDRGDWVNGEGTVAFGFRRLSILDLSPTGSQPMHSQSGRLAMIFNGEVYNFQELRGTLASEGVGFRGGSDSEVILEAFDRWGVEETLPKLNGMFGIALWDNDREELVLVRDRMGIKPLYVARTSRGVAFASELGALSRAPGFDATLDPTAVAAYVRYLFAPAPRTPLRSVQKLRPGHLLRIPKASLGGTIPESRPFWSLAEARANGAGLRDRGARVDDEALIRDFEEILSDAVRLRMIADVPVGAMLSGGLDSSLVVALMQTHSTEPVRTFTIGFDQPEHDESGHARAVADHLGTRHTELMVTDRDALDLVPRLPELFDEPLADPSQIPTYLVSRLAREDVTVALSGDGGDELFAGYTRYTSGHPLIGRLGRVPALGRRLLGTALASASPRRWELLYNRVRPNGGGPRLVGQKVHKLQRMLGAASPSEMYRTLLSSSRAPERFMTGDRHDWDPILAGLPKGRLSLDDMLEIDQRYYLVDDLLMKVDRASMGASLEARVPLLDHRLVEFSWTVPNHLKIRNGEGKAILRDLLYRHVPRELLDRPKTGFTVPVAAWLRGSLRPWAEDHLFGPSQVRDSLFERRATGHAWDRLVEGHDEDALGLWSIVTFAAWCRHWKIGDVATPEATPTEGSLATNG